MPLSDKSRIVTHDQALLPLARVLAGEMRLATGLRLPVEEADARAGDVALALTADLTGEAYRLTITDRAQVAAADFHGAALGTATLLQALHTDGDQVSCPRLTVEDRPHFAYGGALLDVARKPYSKDGRPGLVAEVGFAEWTQNGLLRQPRFEGLRADKEPRDCRRERPRATASDLTEVEATMPAKKEAAPLTALGASDPARQAATRAGRYVAAGRVSRSFMQVLAARATSLPSPSVTSHSTYPRFAPARTTRAAAVSLAFRTGRKKLIFNSTVVNVSPSASVAA
jgi:hypothetical protein